MIIGLILGAVAGGVVVVLVPKLYTWLKAKAAAAKAAAAAEVKKI